MQPTAKKLILGLLFAREGAPIQVREAIDACRLFSITENNVRVAVVRLSSEGLIESHGRGAYALGPASKTTAPEVAQWQNAEARLCEWNGAYLCVHIGNLGRSNRKALKRREWALELLGLRELDRGLYIRPANLKGGLEGLQQRLLSLGLEPDASIFLVTEFDPKRQAQITELWDCTALNQRYQQDRQRLQDWMARCHELETDVAARESYLMGGNAIRQLVFDPWLPEPMVDIKARRAYLETVKQYDQTGKAIWDQLAAFNSNKQPSMPSTMPVTDASSALTIGTLQ